MRKQKVVLLVDEILADSSTLTSASFVVWSIMLKVWPVRQEDHDLLVAWSDAPPPLIWA